MKNSKFIIVLLLLWFSSCKNAEKKDDIAANEETQNTGSEEFDDLSIYNLPAIWTNQDNEEVQLEDLKGKVLVMVMIYTSCKAACPRLVADIRNIQQSVSDEANKNVKYVFVSIDPETDTPQRLKAFAKENKMNSDQWLFLRGSESDTREFAAVLAVSYKEISPLDFSHSNIISVFNKEGVLEHQKEGLGVDDTETINSIEKLAK